MNCHGHFSFRSSRSMVRFVSLHELFDPTMLAKLAIKPRKYTIENKNQIRSMKFSENQQVYYNLGRN